MVQLLVRSLGRREGRRRRGGRAPVAPAPGHGVRGAALPAGGGARQAAGGPAPLQGLRGLRR
eukprot:195193-Lingulodinium_polyedra.AAC.1